MKISMGYFQLQPKLSKVHKASKLLVTSSACSPRKLVQFSLLEIWLFPLRLWTLSLGLMFFQFHSFFNWGFWTLFYYHTLSLTELRFVIGCPSSQLVFLWRMLTRPGQSVMRVTTTLCPRALPSWKESICQATYNYKNVCHDTWERMMRSWDTMMYLLWWRQLWRRLRCVRILC